MEALSVVITGGTRGIGFGLAERFLEKGCRVTLCGTSAKSVEEAKGRLAPYSGALEGVVADVGRRKKVEELLRHAMGRFGRVDIWINNAGIVHAGLKAWELDPEEIDTVVRVNLTGIVNGTVVPFLAMRQRGKGKIFNMEGLGSDGFILEGMSLYGTTKSALSYFTRAFAKEAEGSGVQIGTLSPGMVLTDLLLDTVHDDSSETEKKRRFFNIMADDVETVTAFLCEKILLTSAPSPKIRWLTKSKILFRMLLAPFRKRDVFT